eukprot:5109836-Pyramimonas_sp.AAC.1
MWPCRADRKDATRKDAIPLDASHAHRMPMSMRADVIRILSNNKDARATWGWHALYGQATTFGQ